MDTDYPTGWNWGAFFLGWIWALGHSLWMWAVLGSIGSTCTGGILGIVTIIYLGIKGNELALENYTGTASQYRQQEKVWAIVGLVLFCLSMLAMVAYFLFVFMAVASGGSFSASP